MNTPKHILAVVNRLLSPFPAGSQGAGEDVLREYVRVAQSYTDADLTAGADLLMSGRYPGYDGRFAPSPPQFGAACRKALEDRLDAQALERRMRPTLPPPDIEKTAESRRAVLAKTAAIVEKLAAQTRTEDAAIAKERQQRQERTNARFTPDMSREAVAQRLYPRSPWTVGDPEGAEDAA